MATGGYVQVPMKQMVDLVINSPEDGLVNFNLLHALLHVFVKQLGAEDITVELHGDVATKLESCLKHHKTGTKAKPDARSLSVIEVSVSGDKNAPVFVVEPADNAEASPSAAVVVTKNEVDDLHKDVETLKKRLEEVSEIPSNLGIIQGVRNAQSNSVLNVLQLVNLSKRIDASEVSVKKLGGLVESLIRVPCNSIASDVSKEYYCSRGTQSSAGSKAADTSITAGVADDIDIDNDLLRGIYVDLQVLKKHVNYLLGSPEDGLEIKTVLSEVPKRTMNLNQLFADVANIKEKLFGKSDADISDLSTGVQLSLMDEKIQSLFDYVENVDQSCNDDLAKLHLQFTDLEQDFNVILSKMNDNNSMFTTSGLDKNNQCCAAVHQQLVKLQEDIDVVTLASDKLASDVEAKHRKIEMVIEEVEVLRLNKADKEDTYEALAEKADACTMFRKVSREQFEDAYDKLTKSIEDTLSKLTEQNDSWQHALDEMQDAIGHKLDKIDLEPMRAFINEKLAQLQDRIAPLMSLKKAEEAAGAKNTLRNLTCISCNKDVVMRKTMDPSLKPLRDAMTPSKSIAPFVAYEIGNLRKQQSVIPERKDLAGSITGKGVKSTNDHLLNRYCGGSHTKLTPLRRVTRLSHFLEQQATSKHEVETQTRIINMVSNVSVTAPSWSTAPLGVSIETSTNNGILTSGLRSILSPGANIKSVTPTETTMKETDSHLSAEVLEGSLANQDEEEQIRTSLRNSVAYEDDSETWISSHSVYNEDDEGVVRQLDYRKSLTQSI